MNATCPNCGSPSVTSRLVNETFAYGQGTEAVSLAAEVLLTTCGSCGMEFTGHDAEQARQAAICRHLGLQTPAEILELRESLNLSREAFAQLTGIGTASLARWETGETTQNRSNDNLLFLLSFSDNRARLADRQRVAVIEPAPEARRLKPIRKFRGFPGAVPEALQERAAVFSLRKGH